MVDNKTKGVTPAKRVCRLLWLLGYIATDVTTYTTRIYYCPVWRANYGTGLGGAAFLPGGVGQPATSRGVPRELTSAWTLGMCVFLKNQVFAEVRLR